MKDSVSSPISTPTLACSVSYRIKSHERVTSTSAVALRRALKNGSGSELGRRLIVGTRVA
jgi:hypothetical protein